jgi:hypothetical protein
MVAQESWRTTSMLSRMGRNSGASPGACLLAFLAFFNKVFTFTHRPS